jgi:hypothetical protein
MPLAGVEEEEDLDAQDSSAEIKVMNKMKKAGWGLYQVTRTDTPYSFIQGGSIYTSLQSAACNGLILITRKHFCREID